MPYTTENPHQTPLTLSKQYFQKITQILTFATSNLLNSFMKKIIDYILSTIYIVYFGFCLIIFHLIQVVAFNFFGKRTHQKTVHWLNFCLLHGLYLLGIGLKFTNKTKLPQNQSIIFIANHQSMFDIVGMIWYLHKNFPIFVSKIELAKGIPSISYNLQKSGSALIDRKDGKQAVVEIARMAKYVEEMKFAACIFPEGTRSRTGKLKDFQVGGVSVLLKRMPSAVVIPIAIQNTGKMTPHGFYPFHSFVNLSWTVLPSIDRTGKTAEEIVALAKEAIENELKNS